MKNALALEEIIGIIDNAESYAKIVCDRTYEKATESIGKNDYFKELIDKLFNDVCTAQIKLMKLEMTNLFDKLEPGSTLSIESIKQYTEKCIEQQLINLSPGTGRRNGKSVIIASYTIISACRTAFVEKLAEYLEVTI